MNRRVDPATAGRRVQRLEEALSARLFVKSPQGYALSEEMIYDRLALTVTGEQLLDVYLESRRSLAVQRAGGAPEGLDDRHLDSPIAR